MSQSLSIFMPFYNDAGTVERMITDAFFYGRQLSDDLEVIAVNDGSSDHTLKELKRMRKKFPELKIVYHKVNRGYGGALISGICNSTKSWVFYTDGDAQYHLDELEKLWLLRRECDVVNGYKNRRSDNFGRKLIGNCYAWLIKMIFKTPIKDVDCDYRLMRGDILRALDLKSHSGAITVELVKKLQEQTNRFLEVGVNHYPRVYGRSAFFTFSNIVDTISDEFKLLRELRRSHVNRKFV